jgi:hypothetical protein
MKSRREASPRRSTKWEWDEKGAAAPKKIPEPAIRQNTKWEWSEGGAPAQAESAPKPEQSFTAVWIRMELEIKFRESWEIWPAIRDQLPERVKWLKLTDESGKEVSVTDVRAGGRYHVRETLAHEQEKTERTMKFKWLDREIEVKFRGIGRLWHELKEATNFMGSLEIVDDEGKSVDMARWDIRQVHTVKPERSYKQSDIDRLIAWTKMPRREEKWAPRTVTRMWKGVSYASDLTQPLRKSQMDHTSKEWQSWERRNETAKVWLHLENDEVLEEVTLGRMAEEIERSVTERWGPAVCTKVRDEHFHFARVEEEKAPERPLMLTREEAAAEQMEAIDKHLAWMRTRDRWKEEEHPSWWSAEK